MSGTTAMRRFDVEPLPSVSPSSLPEMIVTPSLVHGHYDEAATTPGELIVVTVMAGMQLNAFGRSLDALVGQTISREMASHSFTGYLGQKLLVDLVEKGYPAAPHRYVLVVGLGDFWSFDHRTACALFRLALDTAVELAVKRLVLPIVPHRSTEHGLNLIGTAAIMRCRIEERWLAHGGLKNLETVEVLCAPQARKHLEEGLAIKGPRCLPCTDPALPERS